MIERQEEPDGNITRRTVHKSAAAVSAAGLVGLPAISGSALADDVAGHLSSDFDLYGIDHFSSPNKLVYFNSLDLEPSGGKTRLNRST